MYFTCMVLSDSILNKLGCIALIKKFLLEARMLFSVIKYTCNMMFGSFIFICTLLFVMFWVFNHQTAFHFVLSTDICASPITLCPSGYERLSKSSSRNFGGSTVTETAF